jgi:hypothetical protein
MEPWGETEESRKHNQFPPNDSFGNQVFNLAVTWLAITGLVSILLYLSGAAYGTRLCP